MLPPQAAGKRACSPDPLPQAAPISRAGPRPRRRRRAAPRRAKRGPTSWMPSGNPFRPGPGRQGHARRPGQGPDRVEARVAGRAEPFGRLADRARRQQHVEFAEDIVETARGTPRRSRSPRYRRRAAMPGPASAGRRAMPRSTGRHAPRIRRRNCAPPRSRRCGADVRGCRPGSAPTSFDRGPRRGEPRRRCVRSVPGCRRRRGPRRGCGRSRCAAREAVRSTGRRGCTGNTARINDTSSRLRQMMPSVSRLWHCILMPTRLNSPKQGL